MQSLMSLAGIAIGGLVVYKLLTIPLGEPENASFPKIPFFFADDEMTFQQGLHTENRISGIEAAPTDNATSYAVINNALYEAPMDLIPRSVPGTKYSKRVL